MTGSSGGSRADRGPVTLDWGFGFLLSLARILFFSGRHDVENWNLWGLRAGIKRM